VVYHYRRLTGFPQDVPLWSYGIWMSRMTYFSAEETRQVARKLRGGGFPCDVIHVDTGWFEKDWACDWKFSPRTFPNPAGYLAEMRSQGFRVSLWQLPSVSQGTDLYDSALANRYVAVRLAKAPDGSNFGGIESAGTIDFTNPEAVRWYQGLLAGLLKLGVAAIKTDFGENIDLQAEYRGMPARLLHNLYALLYQKAAYEITKEVKGEGLIWARAGWVGCQRYPVHWGGDSACTWDGLAGSLRGGLHLGFSGFAFWSHDVPGFHGLPDFMNSWPADDLYVRWTQAGVFTSHMRYHGAQPREPYEYPAIADLVRKWWRLRYALIPTLAEAGREAVHTGFPVLRALPFHHADDPTCWEIDDQFYCGSKLLVAPVLNPEGRRDVYLPEGAWRDLWSGEKLQGPGWLKGVVSPLEHIPVYAVDGSSIPVYPEPVQCTDEMDLSRVSRIEFGDQYRGFSASQLGKLTGL
jgi:alpha-D-xyloside xylohydrolase